MESLPSQMQDLQPKVVNLDGIPNQNIDYYDIRNILNNDSDAKKLVSDAMRDNRPESIKLMVAAIKNPDFIRDKLKNLATDNQNPQSASSTSQESTPQSLPGIIPRPAGGETPPTGQPTTPLTPEQQPTTTQLVTPEVAKSPEYKAEIWKMIEDKKKEVESLIEPFMEQRYGKGFLGKIKKWFGESKYGAVANIGLKMILGGIGAAGTLGSFVTGPFAAAILPFAATYGRKYLLEGAGEALLLAKNWNKRSEMTQAIEKAKEEFDKGIKEIESGSLSPESAQLKLQQLIANRKSLELDAQRKRMEYYQAESKIKPWIQLASSAGAIGWSLMSGLSLGMQDYDKAVQINPADHYQIAQGGHNVSWDPTQGLKWEEVTQNGVVKHGFEWAKGPWSGAPWYTLGHGISPIDYIATYGGLAGTGGSMMVKMSKEFGGFKKDSRADWEEKFYQQMAEAANIKPATAESTSDSASSPNVSEIQSQPPQLSANEPFISGQPNLSGESAPSAVSSEPFINNQPEVNKKEHLKEGDIWKIENNDKMKLKDVKGIELAKGNYKIDKVVDDDNYLIILVNDKNEVIPDSSGNEQIFHVTKQELLNAEPLKKEANLADERKKEKAKERYKKYTEENGVTENKIIRIENASGLQDIKNKMVPKGDYKISKVDTENGNVTIEVNINGLVSLHTFSIEKLATSDVKFGEKTEKSAEEKKTENKIERADEKIIKNNPDKFPPDLKRVDSKQVWASGGQYFGVLGYGSNKQIVIQEVNPNNMNIIPVPAAVAGAPPADPFIRVDVEEFLKDYDYIPGKKAKI